MPRPLPGAWLLISDSWRAFVKQWDSAVRISAWFIPAAIIQNLFLVIPANQVATREVVAVICSIASLVLMVWASVALYALFMETEAGKKAEAHVGNKALRLFFPILLVAIMEALCVLGGFLLLVLPGIYIAIRLGFSQLVLIDKNTRGRQALVASWSLTKGRFWDVLGRQLLGGILFSVLMVIVLAAAMLLVSLVAGSAFTTLMKDQTNPLAGAVSVTISSIVQAAFVPLVAIYEVKLYNALEQTK